MGLISDIRLWAARKRYRPERETLAYPKLTALMGRNMLGSGKPSPSNLRYFSRTPYARRAINAIKSPIAALDWEVVPTEDYAGSRPALADAEIVQRCLERPNESDSFRSLIEQTLEDMLVTGAGAVEQSVGGDKSRPLWLWPVDAQTVRPVLDWDGTPKGIRYTQSTGYAGAGILGEINARKLESRELVYLRLNPASDTPYGYGPLEIAYMSVQRQLNAALYAGNVASNAQPQNMIYAGEATTEQILAFRQYWRNEVEGQGQTPILGNTIRPDVLKLHAGGDDALYLKWQQFLIRELATAFGLSPQNLGLEADVNRNTSETAEDRDWDATIKPMAHLLAAHLNRDVIAERLGMPHLEFRFVGLDREDEKASADIYKTYYAGNVLTPNEQRERLGLPPLDSRWADMTFADAQIAIAAARGAKQIEDPELTGDTDGT